ncbi:DNA-binding response regulator [Sphaerisporangium krabiense]|uniref:DNA-binding NarL/FixJ family response regulator n=1 Tax=Sphaerisporangium krabiense TaxID=763782 RepID=A0A7W8Z9C0_9ACTN|nr:response regulator transcription factor [Sphaerisporangium krabiense]MBB5629894.1 DNA-binding NarL/FixJ family response regulator [Sphaerisporangium krabiense]GII63996.1 DNA-binding response regulator [Sphaerisporangium krabiense]
MRLIIAEDSLLAREGLNRLLGGLGHQVVATATRAEQVLGLVARHAPDAVVLDIRLPPTFTDEGLRLAAAIRRRHPRVAVLILSHYLENSYAAALLENGAARLGYLLKERLLDAAMLDEVLRRLHGGGTAVDPDVVAHLLAPRREHDALARLTGRERDVLALMAQGLSDRGIADRLALSVTTVGTHTHNVFRKLGIGDAPASNRRVNAVLAYLTGRVEA